jgi:sigma-B regulation protein RsbU (phosphoserine phosphatase)
MDQVRPVEAAAGVRDAVLREQLLARRARLREAAARAADARRVVQLLQEVDAALERMDAGTFGVCATCRGAVEGERLMADPLTRNCLECLTPEEQRALERDLDLAFQVQRGLLPATAVAVDGWEAAYHYEPAGPVSGDYCDLIDLGGGRGLFLLGDVTGKGVAASMLVAHLHAIFRSLAPGTRCVAELVARANRVFCQGTVASYFATLVCGVFDGGGEVAVCNAGHCYPLHAGHGGVVSLESTGLPLGLFADGEYGVRTLRLARGDSLVLYTDGLSESFNAAGEAYGSARLAALLGRQCGLPPRDLLAAVLADAHTFRAGRPRGDDLTVMVVRRKAGGE